MSKRQSEVLQFALLVPVMFAVVYFVMPLHLPAWLVGIILGGVSVSVGGALREFIEAQGRLRRTIEEQQRAIERLQAERSVGQFET